MKDSRKVCAYCGRNDRPMTRDHVFPRGLFPRSKVAQSVQRLTVPACAECNVSFSDDEAHFRSVMVLAGSASNASGSVWKEQILPSWKRADGNRRLMDVWGILERVIDGGEDRLKIYPARDERVLRVVKKIIQGLRFVNRLDSPIAERRIWADVLKYALPTDLEEELQFIGAEPEVAEYAYAASPYEDIESLWLLRFFRRVTFIASVSSSAEHPANRREAVEDAE